MNAEKRDEKIRQDIQLELRWIPAVDPESVEVAVHDGVVALAGHIADTSARQAAEQLARRVLGVRSVVNEIQVRRSSDDGHQDVSLVCAVVDPFGRWQQALN